MPTDRSSAGDPARTLALLWRQPPGGPGRGPARALDLDAVVAAAVGLADRDGLDAVTMRAVAQALGVAPMTLYTYVPGRAELLDLMLDAVHARTARRETAGRPWRERLTAVAEENRALFTAHPWAAAVSTLRPPLGPGSTAKYEHELAALDDTGLDDARWWAAAGPLLARVLDPARYPRAVRVGAAAGAAHGSAHDPDHAYRFGLARVLDGLAALIDARR